MKIQASDGIQLPLFVKLSGVCVCVGCTWHCGDVALWHLFYLALCRRVC